jgi:hypothetical protein
MTIDNTAILARAEHLVETLRGSGGVDEKAAAKS